MMCPTCYIFHYIRFTGKYSFHIQAERSKAMSSCYLQIDLRIVFKSGRRLAHFFKVKDNIPKLMSSNNVYK